MLPLNSRNVILNLKLQRIFLPCLITSPYLQLSILSSEWDPIEIANPRLIPLRTDESIQVAFCMQSSTAAIRAIEAVWASLTNRKLLWTIALHCPSCHAARVTDILYWNWAKRRWDHYMVRAVCSAEWTLESPPEYLSAMHVRWTKHK